MDITLIVTGVIAALIIATLAKSVRIVPQAELQVVERLGRYNRVLSGGLNFIVPFVDTIREKFTTQEQLVNLHPQNVYHKG